MSSGRRGCGRHRNAKLAAFRAAKWATDRHLPEKRCSGDVWPRWPPGERRVRTFSSMCFPAAQTTPQKRKVQLRQRIFEPEITECHALRFRDVTTGCGNGGREVKTRSEVHCDLQIYLYSNESVRLDLLCKPALLLQVQNHTLSS